MRLIVGVLGIGLATIGCSGDITGPGAGSDGPDAGPPSLRFTAPAPDASFTRDHLAPTGALVADVPVTVEVGGEVARVEITAGDVALGDTTANALDAALPAAGPATLTATAYDAAGASVATAQVAITVVDPTVADCHAWLDLYHLSYTLGPTSQGVTDPVTVTFPLNGMPFRYTDSTTPRKTAMMDCTLAKSLAEAAPIWKAHDVVEVADYGIYNYRCIGSTGTPPNCPSGMSQHAYAKAIDLVAFTTSDSTTYTVKTDFVIDPDGKTCTAPTEPGKDTWLHQLICELKANRVWNIVLTPNYNADHRDHFHVDLTPNADFIKRTIDGSTPGMDDSAVDDD
jgi:hypothetical protein